MKSILFRFISLFLATTITTSHLAAVCRSAAPNNAVFRSYLGRVRKAKTKTPSRPQVPVVIPEVPEVVLPPIVVEPAIPVIDPFIPQEIQEPKIEQKIVEPKKSLFGRAFTFLMSPQGLLAVGAAVVLLLGCKKLADDRREPQDEAPQNHNQGGSVSGLQNQQDLPQEALVPAGNPAVPAEDPIDIVPVPGDQPRPGLVHEGIPVSASLEPLYAKGEYPISAPPIFMPKEDKSSSRVHEKRPFNSSVTDETRSPQNTRQQQPFLKWPLFSRPIPRQMPNAGILPQLRSTPSILSLLARRAGQQPLRSIAIPAVGLSHATPSQSPVGRRALPIPPTLISQNQGFVQKVSRAAVRIVPFLRWLPK